VSVEQGLNRLCASALSVSLALRLTPKDTSDPQIGVMWSITVAGKTFESKNPDDAISFASQWVDRISCRGRGA
jgi:hypothetical protein